MTVNYSDLHMQSADQTFDNYLIMSGCRNIKELLLIPLLYNKQGD